MVIPETSPKKLDMQVEKTQRTRSWNQFSGVVDDSERNFSFKTHGSNLEKDKEAYFTFVTPRNNDVWRETYHHLNT